MRYRLVFVVSIVALIVPLQVWGQSIPKLKRAEEVQIGAFPNGIEY